MIHGSGRPSVAVPQVSSLNVTLVNRCRKSLQSGQEKARKTEQAKDCCASEFGEVVY